MNSLTILFRPSMSRFMDDPVKKLHLLLKFAMRVLSQLLSDHGRTRHLHIRFCWIYAAANKTLTSSEP